MHKWKIIQTERDWRIAWSDSKHEHASIDDNNKYKNVPYKSSPLWKRMNENIKVMNEKQLLVQTQQR